MEESVPRPDHLVTISPDAALDLSATYIQTAHTWSQEQAELYDDFLETTFNELERTPNLGRLVANRQGVRSYVAIWRNARAGHRIFYKETGEGIYILRVLHTAMNWPDHL